MVYDHTTDDFLLILYRLTYRRSTPKILKTHNRKKLIKKKIYNSNYVRQIEQYKNYSNVRRGHLN